MADTPESRPETEHETETIPGRLEIDHERGVVYFHADETEVIERYGTVSVLRIKCYTPIPRNQQIDVYAVNAVAIDKMIRDSLAGTPIEQPAEEPT